MVGSLHGACVGLGYLLPVLKQGILFWPKRTFLFNGTRLEVLSKFIDSRDPFSDFGLLRGQPLSLSVLPNPDLTSTKFLKGSTSPVEESQN